MAEEVVLSDKCVLLLGRFVESWEQGSRCVHVARYEGRKGTPFYNPTARRARILEGYGYLEEVTPHAGGPSFRAYRVTARGIARWDFSGVAFPAQSPHQPLRQRPNRRRSG